MTMQGARFTVGLTGGIGSGKSLIAEGFAARGASIIDTDVIAHELTAPGGAAMAGIASAFGAGFLAPNGALDRAKMRAHVFADGTARTKLESILHPLIRSTAETLIAEASGSYPMVVVPLLIESAVWKERVGRILVIDCPEQTQIARVMQRSSLSEPEVRAIIANQVSRQERLAAADDVIVNDGPIAALEPQIDRLHGLYSAMAKSPT